MNFEKSNNKIKSLDSLPRATDNTFTNEDEIRYPTEDDLVDIKVLNNNIRLLDEQKAGGADLQNVAKETTPKNIENIVKSTQNTTNTINANITNIKSTVDTINSNVNNINSNVGSNLQNVAKERNQYSIENKTDEILSYLQNVAKETTPKNIENIAKNIQDNVQTLINTKGTIKSIQVINGQFEGTSEISKSISITPVDISKTIVIAQGGGGITSAGPYIPDTETSIIAYLMGNKTLTVELISGGSNDVIATEFIIQVVEFY